MPTHGVSDSEHLHGLVDLDLDRVERRAHDALHTRHRAAAQLDIKSVAQGVRGVGADEQRVVARLGTRHGKGGGGRRLAHAALAAHEDETVAVRL